MVKFGNFLRAAVLVVSWFVISVPSIYGAYSSHQNDQDVNNFLTVYSFARGTKLDDCNLCHPGGSVTQGRKTTSYGSCDYCHITYGLQPPHGQVPLNGYGQAYKDAGRNQGAITALNPPIPMGIPTTI